MSETTILEKRPTTNGQQESKNEGVAWKQVTLGGVSGILMGAGLLYAGQALAHGEEPEENPEVQAPEVGETSHTLENGLKVAAVSDDLPFGEAFAQARAEVGPGGVFHWHGGIYNTYSADEWNNMTTEQKHDFAEQVQPEIRPDELSTPTDAHTDVVVHHVYHHEVEPEVQEVKQEEPAVDEPSQEDVQAVEQQIAENFDMGEDVHIVGYANADGHLAVGYDTDGDGQADVAIIDVDGDFQPSDPDIIMDTAGHMSTLGDLDPTPEQVDYMDNPDVAPDMPDYMNDVQLYDV